MKFLHRLFHTDGSNGREETKSRPEKDVSERSERPDVQVVVKRPDPDLVAAKLREANVERRLRELSVERAILQHDDSSDH